jgi:hypothetical protein
MVGCGEGDDARQEDMRAASAAADEIERLRAENERLRKALAKIAQYDMQFIAIDALCPDERIRENRRSDAHER